MSSPDRTFFTVAVIVQVCGMLSVALTRLGEGGVAQVWLQRLALCCFLCVAGFTTVAYGCGQGCWLSGGITLALMSVGATIDMRTTSPLAAGVDIR